MHKRCTFFLLPFLLGMGLSTSAGGGGGGGGGGRRGEISLSVSIPAMEHYMKRGKISRCLEGKGKNMSLLKKKQCDNIHEIYHIAK